MKKGISLEDFFGEALTHTDIFISKAVIRSRIFISADSDKYSKLK